MNEKSTIKELLTRKVNFSEKPLDFLCTRYIINVYTERR